MQKKPGVSLIVLVITIVVMTILAGAVVLTLNNSRIIDRATNAVEETNLATVKELTQMAWAEAYATGERTVEGLKSAVDKALEDAKIDTTKYNVKVTTSGVIIKLKSEQAGWVQEGLTVTNGDITLEIGDSISYDETNGGTIDVEKDVDWKVLGVEEGNLLIMSTDLIKDDIALNEDDYLDEGARLNEICESYGQGKGAVGARSINVEDVNRVTGYDPNVVAFGKGTRSEYGSEITLSWREEEWPYYTSTNGVEGYFEDNMISGYLRYFDGEKFVDTYYDYNIEEIEEITTFIVDYYTYYPTTLVDDLSELPKGIDTNSKAYIMLFKDSYDDRDKAYYLASKYSGVYYDDIGFGMRCVIEGMIGGLDIITETGGHNCDWSEGNTGLKAVVVLNSDIELTGNSESGWNIQ